MAFQAFLFAYGRLKSGYSPPRTMKAPKKDFVRGIMFDRPGHEDPALIRAGEDDLPWNEGQLMRVSKDELYDLDATETGYTRKIVPTQSGQSAWVYEWNGEKPKGASVFHRWPKSGDQAKALALPLPGAK